MIKTTVLSPQAVFISPKNWFYAGWLDYALGLTALKFNDPDVLVADNDCYAYMDGYETAKETGPEFLLPAMVAEVSRGNLTVGRVLK